MKLIAIVALLLNSSFALANPSVGDYAKFNITKGVIAGPQVTGTLELRITAKDTDGDYMVARTQVINGSESKDKFIVQGAELKNDQEIDRIITNCTANNGTLGTRSIQGVAIPTCSILNSSHYSINVEVAKVPFGFTISEFRDQNSVVTSLTLISYKTGQ